LTGRYAWLCDFDGTVSPHDVGATFMHEFSPGHGAERRALLSAWQEGKIGSRELARAECEWVRATEADATAFVRRFGIDPAFSGFRSEVEARGDRVFIVSDGFDFYVRALLETAGMGNLPWAANRMRFEGDRVVPEFPHSGGCGRCGNCKSQYVSAHRGQGYATVIVGDGTSDRCAAEVADHVIARGSLAEWCKTRGIPAREFTSFEDVARIARSLTGEGRSARSAQA
jgi:2,3-diketo-5-methylthio-1-phosphopentane phosphatase